MDGGDKSPAEHQHLSYRLINNLDIHYFEQSETGLKCPTCYKEVKNIKMHLNKSSKCSTNIDMVHFLHMYEKMRGQSRRDYLKSQKQAARQKKREENKEAYQMLGREEKQAWRQKKREEDEEAYERSRREEIHAWRQKKREEDIEAYKMTQNNEKQAVRQKKIEKTDDRTRIYNFKRAVLFGPIFICSCCHRRLYEKGVTKITENLKRKMYEKNKVQYSNAIPPEQEIHLEIMVNGSMEPFSGTYICHTCKNTLLAGKMPSMAVQNGLHLIAVPEEYSLTELENNLIAQMINFQYIYNLPKSRWGATKNQMISVPIPLDSLQQTITKLPRLPKDAGLIAINLKKKKEYKSSHKKQLIDPDRVISSLKFLNISGHPFYQFCDDFNLDSYRKRCQDEDPTGLEQIFEDESSEDLGQEDTGHLDSDDSEMDEKGLSEVDDTDNESKDTKKEDSIHIESDNSEKEDPALSERRKLKTNNFRRPFPGLHDESSCQCIIDDDEEIPFRNINSSDEDLDEEETILIQLKSYDPIIMNGLGEVELIEILTDNGSYLKIMLGDFGGVDFVEGVEDVALKEEIGNDVVEIFENTEHLKDKVKTKDFCILVVK